MAQIQYDFGSGRADPGTFPTKQLQEAAVKVIGEQAEELTKYPGDLGNSLKVSVCDSADAYTSNVTLTNVTLDVTVGAINFAPSFRELKAYHFFFIYFI